MATPAPDDLDAAQQAADAAYVASLCWHCYGQHEPDTDETYVDFRGYRFCRPFRCMCCGDETCARQWAYGRCCGYCDAGSCRRGAVVQHTHYLPWGPAGWERFIAQENCTPLEAQP